MTNRRFINRHWQRAITNFPRKIGVGFSLIEALVVTGISTIVMSSVLGVVAHQYQVQKRLALLQDFATESQFLVERITQLVRNNTIDYDRYFVEIGPENSSTACKEFSQDQTDEDFSLMKILPPTQTAPILVMSGFSFGTPTPTTLPTLTLVG